MPVCTIGTYDAATPRKRMVILTRKMELRRKARTEWHAHLGQREPQLRELRLGVHHRLSLPMLRGGPSLGEAAVSQAKLGTYTRR